MDKNRELIAHYPTAQMTTIDKFTSFKFLFSYEQECKSWSNALCIVLYLTFSHIPLLQTFTRIKMYFSTLLSMPVQ